MQAYFAVQEQLHERGQTIHDLDRRMEEKERELHAIKLDNEAVSSSLCCTFEQSIYGKQYITCCLLSLCLQAWAKEDLLREQNKELATFRCVFIVLALVHAFKP